MDAYGNIKTDGTIESQINRCLESMKFKNPNYEVPMVYRLKDDGFSGKNTKRPGFQKLVSLIENGQIKFVITSELTRLSRSVRDFLDFILVAEKYNVAVHIIGLNVDTSEPMGKLLLTVLSSMAQFEREMTAQRVKVNAKSRLVSFGKINGASEVLGLVKDPDEKRKGHFVIDSDEVKTLEKILKLYIRVRSRSQLRTELANHKIVNPDGTSITKRQLEGVFNNVSWRYRGKWYLNLEAKDLDQEMLPEDKWFKIIDLPHGPVINSALLDEVEKVLSETRKAKTGSFHTYLLGEKLVDENGVKYTGLSGTGQVNIDS